MTYDDIIPPKTIREAEQNIIGSLILHIEMGLEEEFNYVNWEDSAKKKFNRGKNNISKKLEEWSKVFSRKVPDFEDLQERTESYESNAFEFETKAVKINVKTLEDYLEMK